MATESRHAAWQPRSFAVRLLIREGSPQELAGGLTDFLDALDVVAEWLSREDLQDEAQHRLVIVEIRDGIPEEVWTYPPSQHDEKQELVKLFGFDPVKWNAGVRELPVTTWTSRLRHDQATRSEANVVQRRSDAPSADDIAATEQPHKVAQPKPDPSPAANAVHIPERGQAHRAEIGPSPATVPAQQQDGADEEKPPSYTSARLWVAAILRAAWADPVSRCLVFLAVVGLWLSITLLDPRFLIPALASPALLWWWQQRRSAAAEPGIEDWL